MAVGDEVAKSYASEPSAYNVGITARTAGGQTPDALASYLTNKKAALGSAVLSAYNTVITGSQASKPGAAKDVANSVTIELHVRFSVASANCTIAMSLYDGANTLVGETETVTFIAEASISDGTLYLSPRYIFDVGKASYVYPMLKSISSGNITAYVELL